MRAISNAGPLIHLSWIDQLPLLAQLFDTVIIPSVVRDEVLSPDEALPGQAAIAAAIDQGLITVHDPIDLQIVHEFDVLLDRGEAAALALMQEAAMDLLLLDDRRAREEATRRGWRITGTIGLLREARARGLVDAALPLVMQLRSRASGSVMHWLSAFEQKKHHRDRHHCPRRRIARNVETVMTSMPASRRYAMTARSRFMSSSRETT